MTTNITLIISFSAGNDLIYSYTFDIISEDIVARMPQPLLIKRIMLIMRQPRRETFNSNVQITYGGEKSVKEAIVDIHICRNEYCKAGIEIYEHIRHNLCTAYVYEPRQNKIN